MLTVSKKKRHSRNPSRFARRWTTRKEKSGVQGKLVTAALDHVEEYLRIFFENSSVAVVILSEAGTIRYGIPAEDQVLGWSPEELVGTDFIDLVHPDDEKGFRDALGSLVRGSNDALPVITRCRHKDGSWRVIEALGKNLIHDPRINGMIVHCRDITEQKRSENKILRQNILLQAINRVLKETLTCETTGEVAKTGLSVCEELTGSKFSLLGELNEQGRFDTLAYTDPGMDACRMPEEDAWQKSLNMEVRGVWAQAIIQDKPLIIDDPPSHPASIGTPEGHPLITAILAVPLKQGDRTTGTMVLANKEGGYTQEDLKTVETISVAMVEAVDRKRVQEALRESEERFRTVADFTYDWEYWIDPAGNFVYVSPSCERSTGYRPDEFMGEPGLLLDIIHPHERAEVADHMQRFIKSSHPCSLDFRIITRSGEVAWIAHKCLPVYGPDGSHLGRRASNRDITDRKRVEEEHRKLVSLVENSNELIGLATLEGTPLYLNEAGLHLVGLESMDDIKDLSIDDFVPEGVKSSLVETLLPALKETGSFSGEAHLKNFQTGESIVVFCNAFIIKPPDTDEPGYIAAAASDITEQKRAEAALHASEEKYRLLVENANDAIYILQDGVVKFHNPKTEELTGYSGEEIATTDFAEFIVPEDREMVLERHFRRLTGEEVPSTYAFRIRNKEGEELWVEINAVLLTWEERPAVLCFLRDVTEQRRLEAQLLQAQKMEAIGTLTSGIAHDFNNMMTVVKGYSEILLLNLKEEDHLFKGLKAIYQAGEHASKLTSQLLAFSRKQVLQPEVLDLNSVIEGMDPMLRRLIGEDIEIKSILKPDLWLVEADSGNIEQVIMNLTINARDAMPRGGKLILESSNVELDDKYSRQHAYIQEGLYVSIAVSDTGIGMDEETMNRIFEPFFTTKEKGYGTGLGMAMVYGIVKQSGGYIWGYSEPGHGTTFKIYLPRFEGERIEGAQKPSPPEDSRGSETVLVVEDEEGVRELVCDILRRNGYKVLDGANAGEALLVCEQHHERIDLILTDLVMPKMSGWELAERLTSLHPEMKMMFMSGYTDHAILQRGVLGKGGVFLEKPFSEKSLLQKVREVLVS